MKTINIYALTRVRETGNLTRLERQMSDRAHYLKIRDWEIKGLTALATRLMESGAAIGMLDFFYSYTIPKLGKEFDLLRINKDTIINIELKSHNVDNDKIRRQLMLNRNYLASLNRSIRSYTYISSEDRLVRLSNSGNLLDESFETLCRDIERQKDCIYDNIEQFFKEENYLISPLTDPDRFLKGNYFLTSQQKDIKKHILAALRNRGGDAQVQDKEEGDNSKKGSILGFMGLPGTGKTLLLYDLAMELTSTAKRVIVLHFGSFPEEMRKLDERLKRIDFYPAYGMERLPELEGYDYVFVDEGHRMRLNVLDELIRYSGEAGKSVVISYDYEAVICREERPLDTGEAIDSDPMITKYRLTNRIRMNSELSSFISCIMRCTGNHRLKSYPAVSLYYANGDEEESGLLDACIESGFTYIADNSKATCREFEKVVMSVDETFRYDEDGFLRCDAAGEYRVRRLFHGLNRAKTALAVIVKNNPEVFDVMLTITQGHSPVKQNNVIMTG